MDKTVKTSSFNGNIEKILIKAAIDEEFREKLLKDRKSICNEEEFLLDTVDKMLLTSISAEKLEAMIDNFKRQYTTRRGFFKTIKNTAAILAGAFIVSNMTCCKGLKADIPELKETIGNEGTIINYYFNELQVIIPPGSVDKEVDMTIAVIGRPCSPPENILFGRIYNLSGNITEFKREIIMKFSVHEKNEFTSIYSYEKSEWKKLSSEYRDSSDGKYFLAVKTKTPGIYAVGYREINNLKPSPVWEKTDKKH